MIPGILPCVRNTKQNHSVKNALLCTEGFDSQPYNRPKKSGGKRFCCLVEELQDVEPPKSTSILRKSTKSFGTKRCVHFSKGALRHMKIRERKDPSQGVIQNTGSHERSPHAPKFEDRS